MPDGARWIAIYDERVSISFDSHAIDRPGMQLHRGTELDDLVVAGGQTTGWTTKTTSSVAVSLRMAVSPTGLDRRC